MGDVPTSLLAAASLNDKLVPESSDGPPLSPSASEKAFLAPLPSNTVDLEPLLGRGSAMFSTGLGKRAPRRLQDPPYAPVIVCSDSTQGVVIAAGFWFNKYPQQYLCIFPQAGWQIDDLWDEEDIHIETEPFCREVLKFIERDNCVRARTFAQAWSKMHPERLDIVGGDMKDLYDKSDHLSITERVFVNGENEEYPPIFLWHVAHMMRVAMLEVRGVKLPIKDTASMPERLDTEQDGPVMHITAQVPEMVEGTAILSTISSTRARSSTVIPNPPTSVPANHPTFAHHRDRSSIRISSNGLSHHGGRYTESMRHMLAASVSGGPNFVQSSLHIPRNRSERSASGSHNQSIPLSLYVENMPRDSFGSYPRQHAGSVSVTQSLHLNQANPTMARSMVNAPHNMAAFAYEQDLMVPGMIAGQPLHAGMMHPSMMPLYPTQSPSMTHGYPRQSSGSQGPPYIAPMGDMTNMHYPPSIPPQSIDPRRPGNRRYSQQHRKSSALYDPYEGSNPAFRPVGNLNGKKYHQSDLQNSDSRQRKTSIPGSRPYHSQYTSDRPGYVQPIGSRIPGPKGPSEDDLAITQDHEHGCHFNWIGPQNTTVNELFIKDLPEDIQEVELETLFHDKIGVKPKSINVRSAIHVQYNHLGRKHAFVGFPTAAVARQAIDIRDPAIRGLPVSITVPKRFFQKIMEVPMRDSIEAGPSSNTRYTSHANSRESRKSALSINGDNDVVVMTAATKDDMSYSPQDARSDLHKKKKVKQLQQGSTASGSPEARKPKPKKRQESTTKEQLAETTHPVQNDSLNEGIQIDDDLSISGIVKQMFPLPGTDIEQSQINENTSSKSEEKVSLTATAAVNDYDLRTANSGSNSSTNQQHEAATHQLDFKPQQEAKEDWSLIESSKRSPAKEPMKCKDVFVKPSLTKFLESEDAAPDDELKNDASFHSAEESQFEQEPSSEPGTGSDITDRGTTSLSPNTVERQTKENPSSAPSTLATNTATKEKTMPTAVGKKQLTSESQETIMLLVDSTPVGASTAMQHETSSPKSSPGFADFTKKGGSQHTESLHPFSKASKAQAKREKEQKRKAQKKEREQAERAKTTKAVTNKPAAKATVAERNTPGNSETVTKNEVAMQKKSAMEKAPSGDNGYSVPAQEFSEADSLAKNPISTAKSTKGVVDVRDKPGKHKGKKVDVTARDNAVTTESRDDDHGKQIGGTINTPHEIDSVTKKEVKFDLPENDLISGVHSSKPEDAQNAEDTSTDEKKVNAAATAVTDLDGSAKRRMKKKKGTRVWSSLEFRPRSPNPAWMGLIDMETDVQNYDTIMNVACGGEEDSDFSWDDLPRMASSEEFKQSSASDEDEDGNGNGDEDKGESSNEPTISGARKFNTVTGNTILQCIVALEAQKATTILASVNDIAANPTESETFNLSASPVEDVVQRDISAVEDQIAAVNKDLVAATEVSSPFVERASEKGAVHGCLSAVGVQSAEVDAQLAQRTDVQTLYATVLADSQPTKKKKTNKHKNRKKQQPISTAAKTVEATDITGTAETKKLTSTKTIDDPIDNEDPFYDQLKGIDAIKRGDTGSIDAKDPRSQHQDEIPKPLADPQFMRTMEGYFKETQGASKSKGRKVSKEDLL